jgi:very-long-chain enoyl-CoA reductase
MTPRAHNLLSYSVAAALLPSSVALLHGPPSHPAAWLVVGLWTAHFLRRSAEVLWVHRYSKPTFPWVDALIEYVYYWGFGLWIAFQLPQTPNLDVLSGVGLVVWIAAEAGNTRAHLILSALRREDPQGRNIPRGFLFNWVSCPHYLCEIISWLGFVLIARTWAAAALVGLSFAILTYWATTRHRAYKKDFDGLAGRELYPPARRALLPGVY